MAYVIAEPCIGTKDTTCVDVCPVDCIHPRKDEPEFETVDKLYIDPDECIDCTTRRPVLQSIDRLVFWSEGVKARLQAVGWRARPTPQNTGTEVGALFQPKSHRRVSKLQYPRKGDEPAEYLRDAD
jgi:NAD-dependent dihydropyrimidine dehydrogenase PreA subunit